LEDNNSYKDNYFLLVMELVAFLGNDKENWGQISALVNRLECDKIVLVKEKGVSGFPSNSKTREVSVDSSKALLDLKEDIMAKVRKELSGEFEVALSLASGGGKEHMALISALLSIPVGIRLVVFTKKGIEYIN
jgi:hypothetical protein